MKAGRLATLASFIANVVMASLLLLSVIVLLLFDYTILVPEAAALSFVHVLFLNFALYLVLFVYDTAVIDYYVISRWRPGLMHIPPEMGAGSMETHIAESLKRGPILIFVIALVAAVIAWLLFF